MLSKAIWITIRPETLLILVFAFALFLLWLNRVRRAKQVLSLGLLLCLTVGIFPLGDLLLIQLERRYPYDPQVTSVAGIVVLGGAERVAPNFADAAPEVNEGGDRIIKTMQLANRFSDVPVLYSGGAATIVPKEAGEFMVGPELLLQLGLPESRLLVDSQSRTTAENARLSLKLLETLPNQDPGAWIIVTSAFHMPRAVGSFCGAGWRNLAPFPTDYRSREVWSDIKWSFADNLNNLNTAAKEWVGFVGYQLSGRIPRELPEDCLQ